MISVGHALYACPFPMPFGIGIPAPMGRDTHISHKIGSEEPIL